MKLILRYTIFFVMLFSLFSCHVHRTTRNPKIRTKCPVHSEILIKAKVENEIGAWSSISFDEKQTPYPKVGIYIGCTGTKYESIIKYCPKCGNGLK